MKVSELTGALLDYWAAKSQGFTASILSGVDGIKYCSVEELPDSLLSGFHPSTNWAHGGPIIEREKISVWISDSGDKGEWAATNGDVVYEEEVTGPKGKGPTALIAAMRAYVASKFGNEVPEVG
jgi:hypothetical protein